MQKKFRRKLERLLQFSIVPTDAEITRIWKAGMEIELDKYYPVDHLEPSGIDQEDMLKGDLYGVGISETGKPAGILRFPEWPSEGEKPDKHCTAGGASRRHSAVPVGT